MTLMRMRSELRHPQCSVGRAVRRKHDVTRTKAGRWCRCIRIGRSHYEMNRLPLTKACTPSWY